MASRGVTFSSRSRGVTPSSPNLFRDVCVTRHQSTEDLRGMLPEGAAQRYEALPVCYSTLTDRIINELPKDKKGVMLVPSEHFKTDPLKQ
eukprot:6690163-Pyramimonas_sp.AAC.1